MSACRKCGLPLAFKKNARGKLVPTNPDGSDHFDICRKVQFETVKAKGKPARRKERLERNRFKVTTGYEHEGRFIGVETHYENSRGETI